MPFDVVLPVVPHGIVLSDAVAGDRIKVAIREFSSSEDGDEFITRLEGLPQQLLTLAAPTMTPSVIDHMVAIIRSDRTARVYINECAVFIRAMPARSVKAGEPIYEHDLVDINAMVFQGVQFPKDAGIVCLFSAGWRKGLFFDLGPLGPNGEERVYDVATTLGSRMAYLRSQGAFRLDQEDWTYLILERWFVFASLPPQLRLKMVRFAKIRLSPDALLPEIIAHIKVSVPYMLHRWQLSEVFKPHIDLLAHALQKFEEGDYISCTAIVFPRIEGIMRTLHQTRGATTKATRSSLSDTIIDARAELSHSFSLLLPALFRRYLVDGYFASFEPGIESAVSRNTIGHGVAPPAQFNEKAAAIGLLILDQLFFFMPSLDSQSEENQ